MLSIQSRTLCFSSAVKETPSACMILSSLAVYITIGEGQILVEHSVWPAYTTSRFLPTVCNLLCKIHNLVLILKSERVAERMPSLVVVLGFRVFAKRLAGGHSSQIYSLICQNSKHNRCTWFQDLLMLSVTGKSRSGESMVRKGLWNDVDRQH